MLSASPEDVVRALLDDGALDLPLPGSGHTADRLAALCQIGRSDLSVGRLAAAHVDAVAILTEAGRNAEPGQLYGVWASDRPSHGMKLTVTTKGTSLFGSKHFCTGVRICDRALVTAFADDAAGPHLVELDVASLRTSGRIEVDDSAWSSSAFKATSTGSIVVQKLALEPSSLIGPESWYLDRPGFWHGALSPAAVWAGGALGLADAALRPRSQDDPFVEAHCGALRAEMWNLVLVLDGAGLSVDMDPLDQARASRSRSLSARYLIERSCTEVLAHAGRVLGPGPLAFDTALARRSAELTLYLRQSHGERDLADLHRWSPQ